jgi:hypothetical protein
MRRADASIATAARVQADACRWSDNAASLGRFRSERNVAQGDLQIKPLQREGLLHALRIVRVDRAVPYAAALAR